MTVAELTAEERAEVEADEALWRRAHAIVARHPELDVSGVHHTLVNLRRMPAARLARSLRIGRAYLGARRKALGRRSRT